MRQVLIEKTDTIEQKDYSTFVVRAKQISGAAGLTLSPKTPHVFTFPLKFKVMHGGNNFEMDFKIHTKLATEGVILAAADTSNGEEATLVLNNTSEFTLEMDADAPIIVVTLNERVAFKQIEVNTTTPEGVMIMDAPVEERKADKQVREARKSKKKKKED